MPHSRSSPNSFVARETELDRLEGHLEGPTSIVSVTGPPGVGKSRLAREFLRDGELGIDTAAIDLSEATDRDEVLAAIGDAFGLSLTLSDEPEEQLARALETRAPIACLLDNADAVLEPLATLLETWTELAGAVTWLVTSRERLGLPAEQCVPLAPLAAEEAILLFERRARQVQPDFSADEHPELGTLLDHLDGLPLAIELAAARVDTFPPAEMLRHLSDRFALLRDRRPEPLDDRQTLEGAIGWSWRRLDSLERHLLASLTVFSGGFTLEAASNVLDIDRRSRLLDAIQSLQRKSLLFVRPEHRSELPARYATYEGVRHYASERLDTTELDREELKRRHAAFFRDYVTRQRQRLDSPERREALRDLTSERSNLLAAARRALELDTELAAELILALDPFLALRGPHSLRRELLEDLRRRADAPALLARIDRALGDVLLSLGHLAEARRRIDAAVDGAQTQDLPLIESRARLVRSRLAQAAGHSEEALRECERVLESAADDDRIERRARTHRILFRLDEPHAIEDELRDVLGASKRAGDLALASRLSNALGILHGNRGEFEAAQVHYRRSLEVARTCGDASLEVGVLSNLGLAQHVHGDWEESETTFEEALAKMRRLGDEHHEHVVLGNLGALLVDRGRPNEARSKLEAALVYHRGAGTDRSRGVVLTSFGTLDHIRGDLTAARDRYERARALHRDSGAHLHELRTRLYLALLIAESEGRPSGLERLRETISDHSPNVGFLYPVVRGVAAWLSASTKQNAEARETIREAEASLESKEVAPASRLLDVLLTRTSPSGEEASTGVAPDTSDDLWVAERLVRRLQRAERNGETSDERPSPRRDAPSAATTSLQIEENGYWFAVDDGEQVDIQRRGPSRLILLEMAKTQQREPGRAFDLQTLFEIGWPDEEVPIEAANQRVYAAVATLRDLGLEELLLTTDAGYLIDPDIDVEFVERSTSREETPNPVEDDR